MAFIRIILLCALACGLSNCRKKPDAAGKEVREAGYSMTAEGWFDAVKANDAAVMRKMVEGGFDAKTLGAGGDGAMHAAAAAGAKDAAAFLLDRGFPVDPKGAGGRTPLMVAVVSGRPEMVRWLLGQGADPRLKDDEGYTPIMLAVKSGGRGAVEELAPYNREYLDDALLLASLMGKAEAIDALTNYGASVYARMEDGRTPLMLAAQNGHKEAAALLIDIGASRFATTESGETAQSLAVAAGHGELAGMIEKGFSGDALALESDEEIAEQMGEYLEENQVEPEEPAGGDALADNGVDVGNGEGDSFATDEPEGGGSAPWNKPLAGAAAGALPGAAAGGEPVHGDGHDPANAGDVSARSPRSIQGASMGALREEVEATPAARGTDADLPLVMRHFRQRELPVEVKKVSAGVASLKLPGEQPKSVEVRAGEAIPGSDLVVVRVFSRTEQGKLSGGEPVEVGVVEVEDKGSGLKGEWVEGRPASAHDPVALVEDAATGRRYLAKPGQRFRSADGREFIVNDVRPAQLVIEDTASGEVRTLRLRGPRG